MAALSRITTTIITNIELSLSAALDHAGALQISYQGNPIDELEFTLPNERTNACISIQTFANWSLAASHDSFEPMVTWTRDSSGNVFHTFTRDASVLLTVIARESPGAPAKTKQLKITITPAGSDLRDDDDRCAVAVLFLVPALTG